MDLAKVKKRSDLVPRNAFWENRKTKALIETDEKASNQVSAAWHLNYLRVWLLVNHVDEEYLIVPVTSKVPPGFFPVESIAEFERLTADFGL